MSEKSAIPTVLEGIVSARRGHLAEIRERISHVETSALEPSTRSLYQQLHGKTNRFIMECKSSSPSLGLIREHYQPGDIARVYSRYASGISVLCEPERFGGDYDHLATVAMSTHLPVLCKDFIIDEVQIHAARYYGADAILLMLSILNDEEYANLAAVAKSLGLDVLTEVIDAEEVERALALGAKIIGVNHRNLHDLSIDLNRTEQLAQKLPEDCVVVAESGIRNNATVRMLGKHANAFLVGSQLTSQPDIDAAARELVYGHNKVCGLTSSSAAQAARAAGAVYGGLIFEEASPRNVSRETANKIMADETELRYVAVSRRTEGWEQLLAGLDDAPFALQLHAPYQGSIDAEIALIESVRQAAGGDVAEIWRAISMTQEDGPRLARALNEHVDRLILDAGDGGTGTTFDWSHIPPEVKAQSLLAGGLNASNLRAALDISTQGVDLNSGVESSRGVKDSGLIAEAFRTIRLYTNDSHV